MVVSIIMWRVSCSKESQFDFWSRPLKRRSLQAIYLPSPDLVMETNLDGQVILVPLAAAGGSTLPVLMTLNQSGLSIWRKLDGRSTLEELIEELCRDYAGEKQEVTDDVCEFIDELLLKGLLVHSPDSKG